MEQRTHKRLRRRTAPPAPPSPALIAGALAAAALIVLAVGLMLGRCDAPSASAPAPYASPYDWEAGLEHDGDRLAYYEDGALRSQLGVDVSDHQGAIDWQAVAADGIDFAMVRVGNRGYTEGALYADARGAENLDGAAAAGLDVGAYFFSQAVTVDEALQEADFVLELLDGRELALPVAFDHEPVSDSAGRANRMAGEELAACARMFCERLEQAGYRTMVYGNKQDVARFGGDALDGRPVWFAEYDANVPSAQFDFALWQYANDGAVTGISTPVDMNLRMTDAL